jgi:hypothetical protein
MALVQIPEDDFWLTGYTNHQRQDFFLTIGVTSHKRPADLMTLLHSFIGQRHQNFEVVVTHDTYDDQMFACLMKFMLDTSLPLTIRFSRDWHKNWGASLRERLVPEAQGDWLLLTNEDNYYVPAWLDNVMPLVEHHDMIMWDMVHSHVRPGGRDQDAYQQFHCFPRAHNVDMGSFMVRTSLAKQVGFRYKNDVADGLYCEELYQLLSGPDRFAKINRVMFVHN